ncbi:MAG: MoaD/ThiS family protein [Gammaproteobacteria bacterium]|nr:MAG: MoaD/ThiS family protein [Gammaproteobacteria bacterium]
MAVTVKFFANLRESVGISSTTVEYVPDMKIADVWKAAAKGKERPLGMLTAVNMEYAKDDVVIRDNDEVAFFPMVSGG